MAIKENMESPEKGQVGQKITNTLEVLLTECQDTKDPEVIKATSEFLEACVKVFRD